MSITCEKCDYTDNGEDVVWYERLRKWLCCYCIEAYEDAAKESG